MNDHFATLGIAEDANDDTVRKAYLQLVRTFSPERDPVRFQEIRIAYDALADSRNRLAYRLFHAPKPDVRPMLASLLQEGTPTPPDEAVFLTVLRESLARLRFTTTGELESKPC